MLFVLPAVQTATVELYRGAALGSPGYWAVEDAYLDKKEANEDHGGGYTLLGGDGRTVLLRFGDLARMVGPNRRITAATLVLTPSGGEVPKLKGVVAVDSPWGEGPAATLTKILINREAPTDAKPKKITPRGAATWNQRREGIAPWTAPGAPGGKSVAASGTPNDRTVEIAGLGATAQGWVDRPWTNHGLALAFEGDVEFFSSQSPSGRPRLVLTTEPVAIIDVAHPDLAVTAITKADGKWTARLKNLGAAPAPATKGQWWTDGKPSPDVAVPPLAPNAETTVVYSGPEPTNDPQVPSLAFALADPSSANDRLDVFAAAKPVALRLKPGFDPQRAIDLWNETLAPQSRFSFAPEGAKVRVRLEKSETAEDGAGTLIDALRQIGTQLGLPKPPRGATEDLYPGLMGYGDTRFEGSIPGKLTLPYEPYPDPATETALLEPTGLLSASDVGRLNDPSDPFPIPRAVLLRVVDLAGNPLPGLDLTVDQPGAGSYNLKLSTNGSALLPSRGPDGPFGGLKSDLSNGDLVLRATRNGVAAMGILKAWRVSDAFRRSGSPAIVVDVRMNLPSQPLETETDLAQGRPATDAAGTALPAITDGNDGTAAPLPEKLGDWIDIDLGRDRTLGEISLKPGEGPFWSRFEIRVYATGQRPEDATLWATEKNASWTRRNRAESGWLTYRAPVQRIRFIRLINRLGGPATLAGLRAVPVKLQG